MGFLRMTFFEEVKIEWKLVLGFCFRKIQIWGGLKPVYYVNVWYLLELTNSGETDKIYETYS